MQEIADAATAESIEIRDAIKVEAISDEQQRQQLEIVRSRVADLRKAANDSFAEERQDARPSLFNLDNLAEFDTTQFASIERGANAINQAFRDKVKAVNLSVFLEDSEKQQVISEAANLRDQLNDQLKVSVQINQITDGLDTGSSLLGSLGTVLGADDDADQAALQARADQIKQVQEDLAAAKEAGDSREVASQQAKLNSLTVLQKQEEAVAKKNFKRLKAVQTAQAIISTISAGLKAFQSAPWPANFPAMAAALAAGYAQVRNIQSQSFNSSSIGSSSSSAGGTGGGNSVSNAQVQDQRLNNAGRRGPAQIINLQLEPGEGLSYNQVEDLVQKYNENVTNGGAEFRLAG